MAKRSRIIPNEIIDRVNAETDLVALIGERVRLKRAGKDYVGLCPFHDEKTPSFTVSQTKGFYHCFGCGAHGTAIDFVMETHGIGFRDAVTLLAERLGITITYDQHTQRRMAEVRRLAEWNRKRLETFRSAFPGSPSEAYLVRQRQIAPATLKVFQVGHDAENNRVVFPVHDQRGRVAGFVSRRLVDDGSPKYRNSRDSALFEKRRLLYGLHPLLRCRDKPSEILVTEGCLDVLSLHSHGIANVVAVLGGGFTLHQAKTLYQITDRLVLVFDADEAGWKALLRAVDVVAPLIQDGRYLKILRLDVGDPDEYVRQQGAETFRRQVESAPLFSEWLQKDLRRCFPSNAEGQALYMKKVGGILQKMPPSIFKQMLSKSFEPATRSLASKPIAGRRKRLYKSEDVCDRLMALILRNESLAGQVDENIIAALPELYGARGKLAQRILEQMRAGRSIAHLRERIRGHKMEPIFNHWFQIWAPDGLEDGLDGLATLTEQVIAQYERQKNRKAIEALFHKDPESLTQEERQRIDAYIRELRKHEAGHRRAPSNRIKRLQL